MPAEKMRLRAWIEQQADSGRLRGLQWVDRDKGIFKVPWKHASRQCWSVVKDACVFEAWAAHTGRYRRGIDKPDPRRWKANFRCALNALPDIRELPNQGIARGQDAYKVYQIIRKNDKKDSGQSRRGQSKSNASTSTVVSTSTSREHASSRKSARRDQEESVKNRIAEPPRKAPYYPLGSKPFSGFGFWPTFHWPAHLLDHDYMNTWFDPRPVMEDKGIMAQPDIKQEPLSPTDRILPSCSQEGEMEESSPEVAKVIVKEEDEVPSDQEIIDLVDQMSEQSNSSYEDLDALEAASEEDFTESPPKATMRPPLRLVIKTEDSSGYGNEYATSLPLTPDSTREILSVISRC
ncbi:unnamed protein product [Porites evermanni]|uniref:IRF tryptophan pentad repeat domain-containing protein n=1 Tax=Porites evermanni TaxID=104178 RepID=A0ABN8LJV2_9CNID|nr:unnamed protein product [Porites evermanni]